MNGLYMLAIMPPAELTRRIDEERKNFAATYGYIKALKPPVHITLVEPFQADAKIETAILSLGKWLEREAPIEIELNNFSNFNNAQHPVLYIAIKPNEALATFRKRFLLQVKKYVALKPGGPSFTPHFTIGYRDVPPAAFPQIIEDHRHRRFLGSFLFDAVHLWKHDGSNWQTIRSFPFSGRGDNNDTITQTTLF